MKRFNLVIVHTPGDQDVADWQSIAARIEASAPDIEVRIANNLLRNLFLGRWQVMRPSLVFSASVLRKFKPDGGKIYAGSPLSKWQQIVRMDAAGINVPMTTQWSRDVKYEPEVWGERVIVKPLRGWGGAGVQLLLTASVHERWRSTTNHGATLFLLQRFIDSGPHPNHYRVLTGFGVPLYMAQNWAPKADGKLPNAPRDDRWSLVSDGDGHVDLVKDDAVLFFARAMAAALSEIPVLGCDIVREEHSGKLYALEANTFGQTWHFSSKTQRELVKRTGLSVDYYSQFDGLTLLANELVNRTRAQAE